MSLVRLSLAGRTGESSRSSTASVAARLLAAGGRQRRSLAASTPRDSSGAAPAASSSSSSSSNNSAASSSDATGSAYVVSERPSIAAQRLAVSTRKKLTRELPSPTCSSLWPPSEPLLSTRRPSPSPRICLAASVVSAAPHFPPSPGPSDSNPRLKPREAFYSPPPAVEAPPSRPRATPDTAGPSLLGILPEAPVVPSSRGSARRPAEERSGNVAFSGRAAGDVPVTPIAVPFDAEAGAMRERVIRQPAPSRSVASSLSNSGYGPSQRADGFRRPSADVGRRRPEDYGPRPSSRAMDEQRRPMRDDRRSLDTEARSTRQLNRDDRLAAPAWESPARLHSRVAELAPVIDGVLDGVRKAKRHPTKPSRSGYSIDDRFDMPAHAPTPSKSDANRYSDEPAVDPLARGSTKADESIWGQAAHIDPLEASRLRMVEMMRVADERAAVELKTNLASSREPTKVSLPSFSFDAASFEAASAKTAPHQKPDSLKPTPSRADLEPDSFKFVDKDVYDDDARLRRREERAAKRRQADEAKRTGHVLPSAGDKKAIALFLVRRLPRAGARYSPLNFPLALVLCRVSESARTSRPQSVPVSRTSKSRPNSSGNYSRTLRSGMISLLNRRLAAESECAGLYRLVYRPRSGPTDKVVLSHAERSLSCSPSSH
jgi:hypothetical protein